jgi:hypothetical protein
MGEELASSYDQCFKKIYLPSVEACWDYGLARNAPLVPFIGSLLPYSFLRGVQFDTKVFKLSEFLATNSENIKGLMTGLNARNEITLSLPDDSKVVEDVKKSLAAGTAIPIPKVSLGGMVYDFVTPKSLSKEDEESLNYALGTQVCIALDSDSELTGKITNNWGGGDDILTQAVQGVAQIAANLSEIGRSVGQAVKEPDFAGVPFSPLRYKGSEHGTVTINFTLFTKNNYIRDIYYPLMFLKSLCYPKSMEWSDEAIALLEKGIDQLTAIPKEMREKAKKFIEEVKLKVKVKGSAAEMAAQFVGDRFKIIKPPPLLKVEHSSGLIFMNRAAITEFTYKAEGPWIRMHYDGLFGKIFGLLDKTTGAALDRLIQDAYIKFPSYVDCCYPTRVKCSITLKETEFITRETYREREQARMKDTIITAIKTLGATNVTTSALIAGGIAQNVGSVIPNTKGAGDLLSGGKWVPPGESMVGIPGFV